MDDKAKELESSMEGLFLRSISSWVFAESIGIGVHTLIREAFEGWKTEFRGQLNDMSASAYFRDIITRLLITSRQIVVKG